MARKSDIRPGVHLWAESGYVGIAQGRVKPGSQFVRYSLFADQWNGCYYTDVTIGDAPPAKTLIKMALDHLIESGERFTADEVWALLAIHPNVSSANDKGTLARLVQIYREAGSIRTTGWKVTERSALKSRAVPVWLRAGRRKVAA